MSNIDQNFLNVNESIPPFKDSPEYCQWDDPIELFALVLGDECLLVHLLDLHIFLLKDRL
jgi:hypothetical protein